MSSMLSIGAATITAGAALYMATRPQQFETPLDLKNQSQEVPVSLVQLYCCNLYEVCDGGMLGNTVVDGVVHPFHILF